LTTSTLKPLVYIEKVLNLIIKAGFDEIIRDSLNGVKSIIYLRVGITLQLMQIRIFEILNFECCSVILESWN
jgi:hypothetical protein